MPWLSPILISRLGDRFHSRQAKINNCKLGSQLLEYIIFKGNLSGFCFSAISYRFSIPVPFILGEILPISFSFITVKGRICHVRKRIQLAHDIFPNVQLLSKEEMDALPPEKRKE